MTTQITLCVLLNVFSTILIHLHYWLLHLYNHLLLHAQTRRTWYVCLGITGRGASVAEALCSTDSNRQAETHNKAAIDYTRTSGIPAGVMRVWTVRMFFSP